MEFNATCKKIKDLKIQGATNVAVSAVEALSSLIEKSKAGTKAKLVSEIEAGKKKLFELRATEPMMRNFLNFVHARALVGKDVKEMKKEAKRAAKEALMMKEAAKQAIVKIGAGLIEEGSIVYTHCHASTVTGILKEAAKTKKFEVYNTETRPRFQGRITAEELAKAKIPVTHFVDSAVKFAMRKADIMMIGADAITPMGVYNKIGSGLFAELAKKYDVPVYVCSVSWKFDPESIFGHEEVIEERNPNEVWDRVPKSVRVRNYAFEKVIPENVSAIVSELGIYNNDTFIEETKKKYPWMFLRH
uniref:R15P Isomerase n=1 Tax=uncultured Candidatus Pacearchaeota archaeon TaxID=2109283 RepID=A0A447IU39_9ARCH|nr:R15P Isomerase [uncultured Candidatus Pacearchaeota archaeon]